ncbi:restriction endonuclease subunit S [Clostridium perfringens]|uniref:restriction endonuclease subunit S n=1 Tax=Clostridium perfringens TaxID=1502 RepID=UPI0024695419|nr:restriction endonuclease subunit S [Clostridium perfringens]MDH5072718.1 EcoKI restriction-modification system protein HsdS [Clostridium perfringens]MDK0623388.1 restriction endonuclease subunit S [Clostridium perfringens]MDK0763437.1 restriction endonuclease subunit S [Clostridium perfringens]MDM0846414.1 restriction endonuclease subunit S [Clostridium perfringens]MDM0854798.1 restriction endonuclease subunit S [Clostridium perfringens]
MSFKEKNWQLYKLKDIIQFNPKESIKKKEIAKKIAMDKLEPFTRKVSGYEETEFTSGTKFRNGDTLLARITPCLENGKTAQVDILDENEIGFGSTEYIVLREKLGITFNDYIYYLSISPEFRNMAIKSMTGSSGRQRVQKDVLEESEIILPPLEEQKAIAKILSDLDEKIEVNNKINKNLEEMAQAIFKQWFVDFEFPNEEGKPYKSSGGEMVESELGMIPKGWKICELNELSTLTMGLSPKSSSYNTEGTGTPLLNGAADFNNGLIKANKYTTQETRVCEKGDLVFCIRATIGNLTFSDNKYCLGRGVAALRAKREIFICLIYMNLLNSIEKLKSQATGSVILGLSKPDINNMKVLYPNLETLTKYSNAFFSLFNKKEEIIRENERIEKLRDTLLPKLMSGEIRVPLENNEN